MRWSSGLYKHLRVANTVGWNKMLSFDFSDPGDINPQTEQIIPTK